MIHKSVAKNPDALSFFIFISEKERALQLMLTNLAPHQESQAHSMIFSLSLLACLLLQTVLSFSPVDKDFPPPIFFFIHRLGSLSHTLRLFITAETDGGPLHQLHPCSKVRCDESSEPPLPSPCMLPLPQS